MALTQRLQMRQSQALVMTPQLMQAIKLLQLSNLDLAAYVEGELESNPLLERASEGEPGDRRSARADGAESDGEGDGRRSRRPADWIDEDLETSRGAIEERLGTDLENVFPDDAGADRRRAPARTTSRRPIRNGRAPAAAAARTATTISKPSSRPSRRWPIISPSSLRWRSPIRSAA